MKEKLTDEMIAMRVVKEFKDGNCVNLGTGIPLQCAQFIPSDQEIFIQAENGVLGYGPLVLEDELDNAKTKYVEAGLNMFHPKDGMSLFDMDVSFDMIRGGRIDITVLGAFQVSEKGDLANWNLPGNTSLAIGGGMDLAIGAKRVIVAMEHVSSKGEKKIFKECSYPLTAKTCVSLICSDIAVIEITNKGMVLKEFAPGWEVEDIQAVTEPKLIIADDLKEIEL
jgi:3-oxoacid CoA-transferase subunit B